MYFKRIELRGFKSFVDETRLQFDAGLTAIVGPNGCGKSNIADALRWVLGEQSAKSMRGSRMEDFIFNGSATRKATGFAEVSLTIGNAGGVITTQPYAEYEEITVTRKLYRSGDSEYMINHVPCRLKDIVDVFLDTGVSTRTLSIIEQDQVTRIVNSRPDDRKAFIDEAAGLMKYKLRRNAAMNKLESSQQNLLRLQDIIGELERQRNSLKRQAKKAERYKGFRSEIRECGLVHFAMEYQRHTEQLGGLTDQLDQLKEREAGLQAALSTKRNELESLNARITGEERAAAAVKQERARIESSIERNDDHRAHMARQIEQLEQGGERAVAEIEQIETEMATIDGRTAERNAELGALREQIEKKSEEHQRLRGEVERAQGVLDGIEADREAAARAATGMLEEIAVKRDLLSSIKTRLDMSATRLDTIAGKEKALTGDAAALTGRLAGLAERLSNLKNAFEDETQKNGGVRAGLDETSAKLMVADGELRSVSDEITKTASKRESLKELAGAYEGYGEGVRRLMKLKDEGNPRLAALGATLAESVRADAEMETALAAVLGPRLETIIAGTTENLAAALDILNTENAGAASFVSAGLAPPARDRIEPAGHPALVGRALDLFTLEKTLPANVRELLANTLVARDLAGAMDIWNKLPGAFTVVTVAGEVIDTSGFVSGGSGGAGAAGIVSRRRIIEELEAKMSALETHKAQAEYNRETLARAKEEQEATLAASEKEIRRLEMEIVELSNEIGKVEADRVRGGEALDALGSERRTIIEERDALTSELDTLKAGIDGLAGRKAEADARHETLQEEIKRMRNGLDKTTDRLREKEVGVTQLRGKLESLTIDLRRLDEVKAGLITQTRRLKDTIDDARRRREEMAATIESALAENVDLARQKDTLDEKIRAHGETLEEMITATSGLQEAVAELQGELEEVQPEVSGTALKRSETGMRIENIIERADAEFTIPIEDLRDADVAGRDPEEVHRRLNYLRGEISRIGDVNVSALEEYEQVNKRYEFLKTQRDDLIKSIATLHRTIENINVTTKKMFMETFEKVSKNFEATFKRLFGGGRAEMRLVHEEGKPEPGVEIMVQPPGKKNQRISLLSAGEKAMTAIALLFAVFFTKPSPFCLLDEIDAPLDEANIVRFKDMLMEMREKTQFIVITHNQKTMSFADRLYGVTQEEEGVSKVLAVNLVDERAPAPLRVA